MRKTNAEIDKKRKTETTEIIGAMLRPIFKLSLRGILVSVFLICFTSFNLNRRSVDDGKLEVDIIQVNDVYEISPLQNDSIGGMARVASLKKQVQEKNPNTLLVIAGDFVSPSIYNTVEVKGKNIGGMQMIDAMNAANFDLAIFGNHEFDLKENQLQTCLDESGFDWISSNTFQYTDNTGTKTRPFKKNNKELPETYTRTFTDDDGTSATIGFFSYTINSNKTAKYVSYDTSFATAERLYNKLKSSCDAVIAITHQSVDSDVVLAKRLPGLAMIIGGHEHDMQFKKVGNVYITKAHANARTAFLLKILFDKQAGKVTVIPTLKDLDMSVPKDALTSYLVQRWKESAFDYFRSSGFNPDSVVMKTGEPLDGRDEKVRSGRTNLSIIIADAMRKAYEDTTAIAMYNAGSIRVDDIVRPPVKEIDILKILPYQGIIYKVKMDSALLVKTLNTGSAHPGDGGFLQYSETLENKNGQWFFKNKPVTGKDNFIVAIAAYLVKVGGDKYSFLKDLPTLPNDTTVDVRQAVITYLRKLTANTVSKIEVNQPRNLVNPGNLFTTFDAEKILGEGAHLTDSSSKMKGDTLEYKCAYAANSKDQKTGKTGNIYFLLEKYKLASSAKKMYSSIKTANENHEGVKVLHTLGDEAYFHTDGTNFYFILVRKGEKMFRMKVNKITSKTSLNEFNKVAKNIVAAL